MAFGVKSVTGATVFPSEEVYVARDGNSDGREIVDLDYDVETHQLTATRANGETFVVFTAVPHSEE